MGNQVNKVSESTLLSIEESTFVTKAFKNLAKNSDNLKIDELVKSWTGLADAEFLLYFKNSLEYHNSEHNGTITFQPFEEYYYVVIRGSLIERCSYIISNVFGSSEGITLEDIQKFVSSVLRSYFLTQNYNATDQYKSWQMSDVRVNEHALYMYAGYLVEDLERSQPIRVNELKSWMYINTLWTQIWQTVVVFLYGQSANTEIPPNLNITQLSTLPFCETSRNVGEFPTILDFGKIMFINDQLPRNQKKKWRLLYSSQIHGESFATFLGKIIGKGPTVIVVQDEHDYMFGGYAPQTWTSGPKFYGNPTTTLFRLEPTMQSFMTTGYNNHYQYLNSNQQTIPNGLGMGGQFGYWGLWLDYDFGSGQSSETCTTFRNYVQLSRRKEFRVKNLEVWGVCDKRNSQIEDDDETISILDYNMEEQSMLAIVGIQMHSEGIRNSNPEEP